MYTYMSQVPLSELFALKQVKCHFFNILKSLT
jgi:hypothetical protein